MLVLVVLFGALAYWQVFRTDLATHATNPRILSDYYDPERGRLLDREGNELAVSDPDGSRRYLDQSLAHVLGYLSPTYGAQGAELVYNDLLAGKAGASWRAAFEAEFGRSASEGFDVQLTIDPAIQAAAVEGLAGRRGAVVALDPQTGEVLAMVSVPTYDPGAIEEIGEGLLEDETSPLLNRATQGLYPPGSTFKTVTAAAALENGVIDPDTTVECFDSIVIDGFPIACDNVPQGEGTYPFRDAFTFSVNAIFGMVGVDVGWMRMERTATDFGFGSAPAFTLETSASQLYSPGTELTDTLLASTAFGQGELLATPLQMAMVAAAVANGGVLESPHLGLRALDGNSVAQDLRDGGSRRVLDSDVAATMRDFMVSVVDAGQAAGVAISGVDVGGKTGTAESGTGTTHAWFIAFAPADDPVIAVAVVVEDGGQGSSVAAPIAGAVIRAALAR